MKDLGIGVFIVIVGIFIGLLGYAIGIGYDIGNSSAPSCQINSSGIFDRVSYLPAEGCSGNAKTVVYWQDGSTSVLDGKISVSATAGNEYAITRISFMSELQIVPKEKACIYDMNTDKQK